MEFRRTEMADKFSFEFAFKLWQILKTSFFWRVLRVIEHVVKMVHGELQP